MWRAPGSLQHGLGFRAASDGHRSFLLPPSPLPPPLLTHWGFRAAQSVASISAGNDQLIGDMIAEALDKVCLRGGAMASHHSGPLPFRQCQLLGQLQFVTLLGGIIAQQASSRSRNWADWREVTARLLQDTCVTLGLMPALARRLKVLETEIQNLISSAAGGR